MRTTTAILTVLFLILGGAIAARDLSVRIATRIQRRSLGRIPAEDYFRAIVQAGKKQLLSGADPAHWDETRFLLLDDVRSLWKRNPLYQSWPKALLAKGLLTAFDVEEDPEILESLMVYCQQVITEQGLNQAKPPVESVDKTLIGETLVELYIRTGADEYKSASDRLATYLMERGRVETNGLVYRVGQPVMLVDTVGMICPFLTRYADAFDSPESRALALHQLKEFIRFGIEPKCGLPYQGYNPSLGFSPVGIVGWGRGTGWYAIGLIDTIAYLPEQDPARQDLVQAARNLAQAVVRHELEGGGWGAMMTSSSTLESSATAMIAYFLQRAINLGVISPSYATPVSRARLALRRITRANGQLDFAEGNCVHFNRHSSLYEPASYAQGAALALFATGQE